MAFFLVCVVFLWVVFLRGGFEVLCYLKSAQHKAMNSLNTQRLAAPVGS